MINKLDILKALFDDFLQENKIQSSYSRQEDINLNARVFDFQFHITKELEKLQLNLILNSSISSVNIKNSFNKEVSPFNANDYCLSFFDFLNVYKTQKIELVELIDHFIEVHKEELAWRDIVITASGATRCKTNIRFALNNLRKIGLIQKVDDVGQRVFVPTLRGELIFHSWRKSLNPELFDAELRNSELKHTIKIENAKFFNLFNTLNSFARTSDAADLQVADFLQFKNCDGGNLKENLVHDIQEFLYRSVITKTGIYFKDEKE